ncbi:MAG: dihydroorotate dehydrogenase [Clostridia bacterium]|nr:dihydroorotate dehydrogenase [Clostridia bacterium]
MADLSVDICGVKFKNPVIAASGTFGFGREFNELYDISLTGGISTKGLTMEPRNGNPVPRIAEGSSVILNAVGLQNPGVDHFIKYDLDFLKSKNTVIIANVAGRTLEDYQNICAKLDGLVDMIELNISCPNVRAGGMALGIKPANVQEVTSLCKEKLNKTPLIVKLSPNVESIAVNAQAAQNGGADCISLINTLTGMVIDIEKRKPVIANNTGGVSGAGIMPIALRMVYEASHAVNIPVIGMGGITTGQDAIAFMMAGARAVQVGTANFTDVYAIPRIAQEMDSWLTSHNINSVNEVVDTLKMN